MQDTEGATARVEPETPASLDLDHAQFNEPAGDQVACSFCTRKIATEYWQFCGKILCDACRAELGLAVKQGRAHATFAKSALFGGLTALGCGVAYAIFTGLTQIQFALVTIGIGLVVGRAIQRATRGFGGLRHQVLAVALTYAASAMSYTPTVYRSLINASASASAGAHAEERSSAAHQGSTDRAAMDAEAAGATAESAAESAPRSGGGIVIALLLLGVLTAAFSLAAPFLEITAGFSGLLGLLIIFFGLRAAFRAAAGVGGSITGPHQISAHGAP
jgi:hypothetical protein